jgi:hypothetical protein
MSGKNKDDEPVKLSWVEHNDQPICFFPDVNVSQDFKFSRFILAMEFANNQQPDFMLTASASDEPFWYSHPAGSFRFGTTQNQVPWLRVEGKGDDVSHLDCETNLLAAAFHVEGAHSLPVSYDQDPPRIKISTQSPVKKVDTPINQIELVQKEIIFRPQRAIKIRLLRPEDLLVLDFEFHNFKFSSKDNRSFLEVDDTKKPGLMVVWFQTQHTLEQAFWEDTEIKADDSVIKVPSAVKLPAYYLRAGKSRLVYEVPSGSDGIPLLMSELLNWSRYKLRLNPRAFVNMPMVISKRKTIPSVPSNEERRAAFLESGSSSYGLSLYSSGKYRGQSVQLYSEQEMAKVLPQKEIPLLRPAFDLKLFPTLNLKPGPLSADQTSIEAPTLLYISPNQTGDFSHKSELEVKDIEEQQIVREQFNVKGRIFDPLQTNKGQISELWHTALGVKLKDGSITRSALEKMNSIRALWAFDANEAFDDAPAASKELPFKASLSNRDRHFIVHQTSNFTIDKFKPRTVQVNQLMLSSLGCYLDLHGVFYEPGQKIHPTLNLKEWQHKATLGRDHYVKVVYAGYLFPFGHQASLVKVTERKFDKDTRAAVNRQRMYVVVLEPEKLYQRTDPNNKFIPFPFLSATLQTASTPNLNEPKNIDSGISGYNFLIKSAGKPYLFDLKLVDKEGEEHQVFVPLIFIDSTAANSKFSVKVNEAYTGTELNLNRTAFNNRNIGYAPSLIKGDTSLETASLSFGAVEYPAKEEGSIRFHPVMLHADVIVKQLVEMTGVRQTTKLYLEDDNNAGHVFAKLDPIALDFGKGTDKSGGFVCPNMGVTGLSRILGPIGGDINNSKALKFIPADFFQEFGSLPVAKLFGVISIFDLLKSGADFSSTFKPMVDKLTSLSNEIEFLGDRMKMAQYQVLQGDTEAKNTVANLKAQISALTKDLTAVMDGNMPQIPNLKTYTTPDAFVAQYSWCPVFDSASKSLFAGILEFKVDDPKNALTVNTTVRKPFVSGTSQINGEAKLQNFGLNISLPFKGNSTPILGVNFDFIRFITDSQKGNEVKVQLKSGDPIKFMGPLSFVNNLQKIIPADGFAGSGMSLKREGVNLILDYQIAVPSIEIGVCTIANLTMGATLTLPLNGKELVMAFNFCRRENPFLLTVSCFGGGGFLVLETYLDRLKSLEGAFEFGGSFSLNVGVASGGVKIMGGFYFAMQFETDNTIITLGGYLRINGHLSIIGMINVSLEFYLELIAVIVGDKVSKMQGTATLKVKVEVLFFSKTVSVTVRREINGADADPKFLDAYEADDWETYCLAFA